MTVWGFVQAQSCFWSERLTTCLVITQWQYIHFRLWVNAWMNPDICGPAVCNTYWWRWQSHGRESRWREVQAAPWSTSLKLRWSHGCPPTSRLPGSPSHLDTHGPISQSTVTDACKSLHDQKKLTELHLRILLNNLSVCLFTLFSMLFPPKWWREAVPESSNLPWLTAKRSFCMTARFPLTLYSPSTHKPAGDHGRKTLTSVSMVCFCLLWVESAKTRTVTVTTLYLTPVLSWGRKPHPSFTTGRLK